MSRGELTKMNKQTKVVGAVAIGALLVGGFAGIALAASQAPDPITKIVTEFKEVPMPYEVVKEVPVVNAANLELEADFEEIAKDKVLLEAELDVYKRAFKSFEDREIIDDYEDAIEEVLAEDDALAKAVDFIKDNEEDLFDMLEDEGIVADEDDVELRKVYGDIEDVTVKESDFEDDYYEFKIAVKIDDEDADVKKIVQVTVELDEGDMEIVKVQ